MTTNPVVFSLMERTNRGKITEIYTTTDEIYKPAISGGPSRNDQPAMDPHVVYQTFDAGAIHENKLYLLDYLGQPAAPWFLTEGEQPDFKVTNWPCKWDQ